MRTNAYSSAKSSVTYLDPLITLSISTQSKKHTDNGYATEMLCLIKLFSIKNKQTSCYFCCWQQMAVLHRSAQVLAVWCSVLLLVFYSICGHMKCRTYTLLLIRFHSIYLMLLVLHFYIFLTVNKYPKKTKSNTILTLAIDTVSHSSSTCMQLGADLQLQIHDSVPWFQIAEDKSRFSFLAGDCQIWWLKWRTLLADFFCL